MRAPLIPSERPQRAKPSPVSRPRGSLSYAATALSRTTYALFLLALPVAYDMGDSTSTDVSIGLYGGYGQYAAITRGCSGEVLSASSVTFSEGAASAEVSVPASPDLRVTFGARGGQLRLHHQTDPNYLYGYDVNDVYHMTYVNPYISLDRRKAGFGLGVISGRIPYQFSDILDDNGHIAITGHLRLGSPRGYFLMSLGENTPLVSGGGLYNIGAGYRVSRDIRMFSGLSALFYDKPGFLQRAQFRLGGLCYVESAARFGVSEGIFEGSGSLGLVYHFH